MTQLRTVGYWLLIGLVVQVLFYHSINAFTGAFWWHVIVWPWALLVAAFWWMVTIIVIVALVLWALTAFNPKVGVALKYFWAKFLTHIGF